MASCRLLPAPQPHLYFCSFSSFSLLACVWPSHFFHMYPQTLILWQLFGGMQQLGSLCLDTSPSLSSPMELVKSVSSSLLSPGLEYHPGFGFGRYSPEGAGSTGGANQLGRATPNVEASLEGDIYQLRQWLEAKWAASIVCTHKHSSHSWAMETKGVSGQQEMLTSVCILHWCP